jgi:hypothetical protein
LSFITAIIPAIDSAFKAAKGPPRRSCSRSQDSSLDLGLRCPAVRIDTSAGRALSSPTLGFSMPTSDQEGNMERPDRKVPAFRVVAYVIMIAGILLFVLTPFFIKFFRLDTDLMGIFFVLIGLAVLIVGMAIRLVVKKRGGR